MNHKVTFLEDDDYDLNDDIEQEYDLGKLPIVRRGFHPFMRVVVLDPDVADFFKTPEAVNNALRQLMNNSHI